MLSGSDTNQIYLIRRVRWKLKKLLRPHFLLPRTVLLTPDEMSSVKGPDEAISVIGIFDPGNLKQGDILKRNPDDLFSFVKMNYNKENILFYDFVNPQDYNHLSCNPILPSMQRENRLFINEGILSTLSKRNGSNTVGLIYVKLPSDDRGEIVPDFMIECLQTFVRITSLTKSLETGISGNMSGNRQVNVPQIRMYLKDLNVEYKYLAKQTAVIQDEIVNHSDFVPISYSE